MHLRSEQFAGWTGAEGYDTDQALSRHMRAFALTCAAEGLAPLPRKDQARRRIRRLTASAGVEGHSPLLGKAVEAAAHFPYRLAAAGREGYPACRGEARIALLARELLLRSQGRLDAARFRRGIQAFLESRELGMEEIELLPEAVKRECTRLFGQICREALLRERQLNAARAWAAGKGHLSSAPAFLAQAAQLAKELSPSQRVELEGRARKTEGGMDALLRLAQEQETRLTLWLEHLPCTMHEMGGIDMQNLLEGTRAGKLLMEQPGYTQCDEASRAFLRSRISALSRACRVSQAKAVEAAAQAVFSAPAGSIEGEFAWYWATDEGARRLCCLLNRPKARISRIVPDPHGYGYITGCIALGGALFLGFSPFCGLAPMWPAAFVACMGVSIEVIQRIASRIAPFHPLLRLQCGPVGRKRRTLVVIPALLSSPQRAKELAAQLRSIAAGVRDEDVEYCLLGDFADAPSESMPEDEAILSAAREAIAEANHTSSDRFHLLHRSREWNGSSQRWMGRERKRGAICALNNLLLWGNSAFLPEDDAARLQGAFRYVVTLDADTLPYPGAIQELIGAISHPVNASRVSVIQPRMALSARGSRSLFVRILGGDAGVNGYGGGVFEIYQDLCGQGGFAGKGIYDVAAFARQAQRPLPENAVLSHDLLEGFLAGSAFAGDIVWMDGFPSTLASYFKRMHRWTRGDWQLLPFLGGRTALQKFRFLENLRLSLSAPCVLALLLVGLWGNRACLILGGLALFAPALLAPGRKTGWIGGVTRLSLLPNEALCRLDAICRALWRMGVSHKNMLEWVSAADADRLTGKTPGWPRWICTGLCLPGLFRLWSLPWAAACMALFLLGGPFWERHEHVPEAPDLSAVEQTFLRSLAEDTWRYFSVYVSSTGLPPDNVQFVPDRGAAQRTSPTNIGLYMASCCAAKALGIIDGKDALSRLHTTAESLRRMEKWHGLPYNWIHPETLAPLEPRTVSSVDCGNLAACLLLCAEAAREEQDLALSAELEALAQEMELERLYDPVRHLFHVGLDARSGALSPSHYDLLSSEARILSYTAIAMGKAPVRHWRHLARSCGRTESGAMLLSWSGTMFEYLMPELFLETPEHSLVGQSCRICVSEQRRHSQNGFWGVSESGFYAFDSRQNYQYRAFGVAECMLQGERTARVIAPYASALALEIAPQAAAANLRAMAEAGFATPCGLAEAIDFAPERLGGEEFAVVRSAMAHHQGMTLLALANALKQGCIRHWFSCRPEMAAMAPLLDETPARLSIWRQGRHPRAIPPLQPDFREERRLARAGDCPQESCLLSGGESTLFCSASGQQSWHMGTIQVNRWNLGGGGFHTYVRTLPSGTTLNALGGRALFSPGMIEYQAENALLGTKLSFCLSPEDGSLLRRLTLRNQTNKPLQAEIRDCTLLSLCGDREAEEHPAFVHLFTFASQPRTNGIELRHLPGNNEPTRLLYTVSCSLPARTRFCADRALLLPHGASVDRAEDVFLLPFPSFHGESALQPMAASSVMVELPPRAQGELILAMQIGEPDPDRWIDPDAFARAANMATVRERALRRFCGLYGDDLPLAQRAAAFCYFPMLRGGAPVLDAQGKAERSHLWSASLSGDLPILVCVAEDGADCVRALIRLHAYWHGLGLQADLVALYHEEPGYDQPLRDQLWDLFEEMRLQARFGQPGGAHILAMEQLRPEALQAIYRYSCILLRGNEGLSALYSHPYPDDMGVLQNPEAEGLRKNAPENASEGAAPQNWGSFAKDGSAYIIDLAPMQHPPVAWHNMLVGNRLGALVSERGGGFFWQENSRLRRITPFANDPFDEGFGLRLWLEEGDGVLSLIPAAERARRQIRIGPGESLWRLEEENLNIEMRRFTDIEQPVHAILLCLRNQSAAPIEGRLCLQPQFLMGSSLQDARAVRVFPQCDLLLAEGAMPGWAGARLAGGSCQQGVIALPVRLQPEEERQFCCLLAADDDKPMTEALLWSYDAQAGLQKTRIFWRDILSRCTFSFENGPMDSMLSVFLPYQALASRLMGRCGPYQAGGAYGFRDQLQDAICLLPIAPQLARKQILLCAEHQFPEGDVQHWWHPPYTGVRTRISDDLLFLPWAAALYARETGDRSIFETQIPYLSGAELPPGQRDLYTPAEAGPVQESLHDHCMRALRRSLSMSGPHGLPLMGGGDWNDGMDQVGAEGKGESLWLAAFLVYVLERYAAEQPQTAEELLPRAKALRQAIEQHGWDGQWYLRAYRDDGSPLGSAKTTGGCRIDLIAQCWAVLAGMDESRCRRAMDSAWDLLWQEDPGILRLLDPPFRRNTLRTGYIAAYPEGIRENGGQYTHAACWAILSFAALGDRQRAWKLLRALMPFTHAQTREDTLLYRVEPYVVAADLYAGGPDTLGRGGWTWYTGSAGWLFRAALNGIAGYQREGTRVRICALLEEKMDELAVHIRYGKALYHLISRKDGPYDIALGDWLSLQDDGDEHTCVFPAR